MRRKLFVSHSSKTPQNLALLQEVCNGLSHKGFEILVDRGGRIYAGTDWDLRLNEWMAECHAAVILFSTAALEESDWVRKEAAILSWRRELEQDFLLIPVLLEQLTPEDLEQGLYRVLRISRDQCVRSAVGATPIVDAVALGLGPAVTAALTPFERLEDVLTSILEEQARAEILEDTWNALDGGNKPPWQHDSGRRFASALARYMLRDRRRTLEHLQTVLDRIRPRVDRDDAEELLKYLACLWVDAEAAGGLSAAAHRGAVVGLNGNYLSEFTAKRYAERAWPISDQWRLVPVDSSQYRKEAIVNAIREGLRPKGRTWPEARIDKFIKRLKDPVLVLIPGAGEPAQFPDENLLGELRAQYPNLTYVIGTGAQVPEWMPETIEALMPPLDTTVEEDRLFALEDVQDFIDNRLYGSP